MRCDECGAELPSSETCLDRFHALLAAEADSEALRQMHGLTVLTYYMQHPTLTKPWYQIFGAEAFQRIFGQGEPWLDVLLEEHPRGVGRRRSAAAITQRKANAGKTMPPWVITQPIPGELTVTAIDLNAASGQAQQVLDWARSVAANRVPGDSSP